MVLTSHRPIVVYIYSLYSEIDPCDAQPCLNGGQCFRGEGQSFACVCPEGFTGPTCEIGMWYFHVTFMYSHTHKIFTHTFLHIPAGKATPKNGFLPSFLWNFA